MNQEQTSSSGSGKVETQLGGENAASTASTHNDDEILDQQGESDREKLGIKFKDWGFKLDRLFEVAYRFYKRNESKAFHPSFDVRNQMNALILQARYGNFDSGKAPDIGTLDLVGKNRRYQWSLLKGMSKTEAMSKFICTLDDICPFFKAYAEAVKISSGLSPQSQLRENGSDRNNGQSSEDQRHNQPESDEQLKAIHTSLCRQTYDQFKNYAVKQYPNNSPKQKSLITSLQEQYYQQYISQMHPEFVNNTATTTTTTPTYSVSNDSSSLPSPAISESHRILAATDHIENNSNITPSISSSAQSESFKANTTIETNLTESRNIASDTSGSCSSMNIINEPSMKSNQIHSMVPHLQSNDIHYPTNNLETLNQSNVSIDIYSNQIADHSYDQHNLTNPAFENPSLIETMNYKQSDTIAHYSEGSYPPAKSPYQMNIDPQSTGSFESYPEPEALSQPSNQNPPSSLLAAINLFNPSSDYKQPQPHQQPQQTFTSLYNASQNLSSTMPPPLQPQAEPVFETPYSPSSTTQPIPIQRISPSHKMNDYVIDQTINQQQQQPVVVDTWSSSSSGAGSPLQQSILYEPLEPASIWTKKGVNEFKDSLLNDKHGGAYNVKQGTLLKIEVPTYPDGRYIYFEFVTEDYDIAFGLDFIYETNLTLPLSLKISEETDEDEDDCDIDDLDIGVKNYDLESATEADKLNGINRRDSLEKKRAEKLARANNTITIVPTYRRDCHEEVFVGRHRYPGQGYYILKFDNTYSLLRSKSLFFRICYFI